MAWTRDGLHGKTCASIRGFALLIKFGFGFWSGRMQHAGRKVLKQCWGCKSMCINWWEYAWMVNSAHVLHISNGEAAEVSTERLKTEVRENVWKTVRWVLDKTNPKSAPSIRRGKSLQCSNYSNYQLPMSLNVSAVACPASSGGPVWGGRNATGRHWILKSRACKSLYWVLCIT